MLRFFLPIVVLLLCTLSDSLNAHPAGDSDVLSAEFSREHPAKDSAGMPVKNIPRLLVDDKMKSAYKNALRRVFFFDSNGVLLDDQTDKAQVRELLATLAADKKNKVYILSAREMTSLEEEYGHPSGVIIASEHGLEKFDPSQEVQRTSFLDPKKVHIHGLQDICKSIVNANQRDEEGWKHWLYKFNHRVTYGPNAVADQKEEEIVQLIRNAVKADKHYSHYRIEHTPGYINLLHPEANKGSFVKREFPSFNPDDFVMCMGDSVAEEPMHKVVNARVTNKYSVIVSSEDTKKSSALYKLGNVGEVHRLVKDLVDIK